MTKYAMKGKLTEKNIIKIMYNSLCALHYLRTSNVMHRDLKPENMLIDPVTLDVRICDFGLSRTDPEPFPDFLTP
jgi:serine/threonine protein kinase